MQVVLNREMNREAPEFWACLLTIKTRDKGRDDASTRTLVSTDAGSIGHRVGTEALIRLGATHGGQTQMFTSNDQFQDVCVTPPVRATPRIVRT